ncbi:SulP family inorganic anion transporter [Kordia sp.]|uniref:SulP family inorganic anion transporter n=1 Tax=Kordia sp. TaxID=1965332 RepID=UPI003B5B95E9
MNSSNPFKNLKADFPASIVVFFVALPLCLGIALASGAPPISGLISGIIGGIIVGIISGSHIGVSGPAAGLAAIVFAAIASLGFKDFLVAVVLAGVIQILFGVLRLGIIGYFFPSSVIRGMLTGIGIIIILKEIPYFFGYDPVKGEGTFAAIASTFSNINMGSTVVGIIGIAILLLWQNILTKKAKIFQLIQGPLVAVIVGIIFYIILGGSESLGIPTENLVEVPLTEDFDSFKKLFVFPNWSVITNPEVLVTAFTIALVASLETLLCVEATDKLDPLKRVTPTNRELIAQGAGNMVSGLIGGLPITQVIVRSSANIQSGGKTKMSAIIHGFFLLISIILIPTLLNKIPLAVLAAILFLVGYKLAKPSTFKKIWDSGWMQFVPFIVTVLLIVFKDLLWGIGIGLAIGIIITLFKSYQNSHFLHKERGGNDNTVKMTLAEEVTFFNKATILKELDSLPRDTYLELDVRKTSYLDYDVIEILDDFKEKAQNRNISVKLISERGTVENPESYLEFFKLRQKQTS